jgi:hypothetical protein
VCPLLDREHDVIVFESADRPGGRTNTVRIELPDGTQRVDTGFIVFNDRNYPLFTKLLDRLGVASQDSDMSFSVSDERTGMEWRGTSLNTVFAQRGNLLRPAFLPMLADVAIFERPDTTLEEASTAKLDRICQLLDLGPEDHVVEIGTGWGGFAVHAATVYGCRVTTTKISDAQYQYAAKRVAGAGLGATCRCSWPNRAGGQRVTEESSVASPGGAH